MKPNKVLQFAHSQVAKSWTRFQLLPMRESLDPTQPAHYILTAQGERGDGVVFEAQAALMKERYDLLPPKEALRLATHMSAQVLQQLQTYTGCACKQGEPCEVHKQVVH